MSFTGTDCNNCEDCSCEDKGKRDYSFTDFWPFLELTTEAGGKILLNSEKVLSINENKVMKITQIWVSPVDSYSVKETYEQIKEMLCEPLKERMKGNPA